MTHFIFEYAPEIYPSGNGDLQMTFIDHRGKAAKQTIHELEEPEVKAQAYLFAMRVVQEFTQGTFAWRKKAYDGGGLPVHPVYNSIRQLKNMDSLADFTDFYESAVKPRLLELRPHRDSSLLLAYITRLEFVDACLEEIARGLLIYYQSRLFMAP